ncbi:MAG: HNH endonuclease [Acidimicrobiales bacterium]
MERPPVSGAAAASLRSAQIDASPVHSPLAASRRALVLNATFEPLSIVSSRRAVLLVLGTKAETIHATERVFRAQRVTIPEPSVVRLVRYVRVPYDYRVAVNRRTVFARDGGKCQYCGLSAENLDHVIPRSKGGPHTWENVVAACRACNTHKEDRLPHEAGMVLRTTPTAPRHRVQLLALCGNTSEDWSDYLGMDGGAARRLPMSDSVRVGSLADRGAQGVGGRTA